MSSLSDKSELQARLPRVAKQSLIQYKSSQRGFTTRLQADFFSFVTFLAKEKPVQMNEQAFLFY